MTREELIENASKKYCQDNIPNLPQMHLTISTAFEAGAEWADAHPVKPWHKVADGDLPKEYKISLWHTMRGERTKTNLISMTTAIWR